MTRAFWIAAVVIGFGTLAASAVLYPSLPDRIPIHWNIRGEVDGHGSRTFGAFFFPGVILAMIGLLALLPKVSPRSMPIGPFRETYAYIAFLVTALFAYIHGLALAAAMGHGPDFARAILGGLYLFFALMGNVLGKITRNPWVGIRVPWTLASDRVWNATHRLGAWMFVACGLTGLVLVAVGTTLAYTWIPLVPTVVVPVLYSWLLSRKLRPEKA